MKRIKFIILILITTFIFSSCDDVNHVNTPVFNDNNNNYCIVVKGLSLKYVLIDTAYEIYEVCVLKREPFTEEVYKSLGDDVYNHYLWLVETYNSFDEEMIIALKTIMEDVHPWSLMNITSNLSDNSGLTEIIAELVTSRNLSLGRRTNQGIKKFFPYFYNNHLKEYLIINESRFLKHAEDINKRIIDEEINIIDFMEEISGMRFKENYSAEFYYTLRPIGAMGFNNRNKKISTLQRNNTNFSKILTTPFHEFSHEFFQTFTRNSEFKKISNQLQTIDAFKNKWNDLAKYSYDWVGWCEENLVEGFAKYLEYKYYGTEGRDALYVYDLDFFNYLKKINFDSHKITLKQASIDFYKTILNKNN